MSRSIKSYKTLHCKLDKATADKLDEYVEKTKMSKTATVEKALELLFEMDFKSKE